MKPELRADGLIYWSADSDSALTKGLAALLVTGLSGCTAQEIMQVSGEGGPDEQPSLFFGLDGCTH